MTTPGTETDVPTEDGKQPVVEQRLHPVTPLRRAWAPVAVIIGWAAHDPNQAQRDVSHSLTAIDIEWFMPLEAFKARMGEFSQMVKSRQTRPGFSEILIPGEQEARRVAKKSAGGVPLDDEVLEDLQALGRELSLKSEIAVLDRYQEDRL